jgi:NADH dehydrogenase
MKVAIFGGSGFVGEYIINELLDNKHVPYVLLRYKSESKISRHKECQLITGDLDNPTAIEQTMMNAEVVIYNIGIIREFKSSGMSFEKLHLEGLIKCVKQAKKLNIKRFILMSANGVKENGTGYQTTKFHAENYLKESGLDWTIFRPSLIFGNSRGKQEFCKQLKQDMLLLPFPAPLFHDGLLPFKAGAFKMSPIHVEDVARIFVKSLSNKDSISKMFELGGEDLTWKEITKLIAIASDKDTKIFIPAPVLPIKIIAGLLDRFSAFPIAKDQLIMLLEGNTCDGTEAFDFFDIKEPTKFNLESLNYLKND